MVRRVITVVVAVGLIVGAMFINKLMNSKKTPPPRKELAAPVKGVKVMYVQNNDVSSDIFVTGRLQAKEKIMLAAEVSGKMLNTSKPFKEGTNFSKGETLFQIEDTEARTTLQAQKAALLNAITQMLPDLKLDYADAYPAWQQYVDGFNVNRSLREYPKPKSDKEKYFVISRNIHNQFYSIKSQEIRMGKYTVIAPFSGTLTQALSYPGSIVQPGQQLGQLTGTASYEFEAPIRLKDLKFVKVGSKVTLTSNDIEGKWTGTIRRISKTVDPNTQMVKLYIATSGRGLREGMYLQGEIKANTVKAAFEVPRDLLIDNQYVYTVKDNRLIKQLVSIVRIGEDKVIVTGLTDGSMVAAEPVSGAFDGLEVMVVNPK